MSLEIYIDPKFLEYVFVVRSYPDNLSTLYKHVIIPKIAFDDMPDKAKNMIFDAIARLNTDECWKLEPNIITMVNLIVC